MASLNIQRKVDSAERLAAIANKPNNQFIFAREFNRIVNQLENLSGLVQFTSESITSILSQNTKVELGEIEGDPYAVLNAMETVNLLMPVLLTYTASGVFFVEAFIGTDGTYGSSTNLELTSEDFVVIYQSDSVSSQPQEYEFRGKLNQVGTNQPTIAVVKNTFPVDFTIFEDGPGYYFIQFTPNDHPLFSDFTPLKTSVTFGSPGVGDEEYFNGKFNWRVSGQTIFLYAINTTTNNMQRGYLQDTEVIIKYIL